MTAVLHADALTCLQSKSQNEDCTGKQQGPTTMSQAEPVRGQYVWAQMLSWGASAPFNGMNRLTSVWKTQLKQHWLGHAADGRGRLGQGVLCILAFTGTSPGLCSP